MRVFCFLQARAVLRLGHKVVVNRKRLLGEAFGREVVRNMGAKITEGGGLDALQDVCQGFCIARGEEEAVDLFANDVEHTPMVGGHHGGVHRQGFGDGAAKAFGFLGVARTDDG